MNAVVAASHGSANACSGLLEEDRCDENNREDDLRPWQDRNQKFHTKEHSRKEDEMQYVRGLDTFAIVNREGENIPLNTL